MSCITVTALVIMLALACTYAQDPSTSTVATTTAVLTTAKATTAKPTTTKATTIKATTKAAMTTTQAGATTTKPAKPTAKPSSAFTPTASYLPFVVMAGLALMKLPIATV